MVDDKGDAVKGDISPDGLAWSTTEPLGYNKQYTVTAQVLRARRRGHRDDQLQVALAGQPHDALRLAGRRRVVGVGQPIAVRFDENIPNRAAAEKAITVTTDPPVEGAFYWLSNREVRWRPENFWEPGTTVTVEVKTFGVDLGDGLFGQEDLDDHLHHR